MRLVSKKHVQELIDDLKKVGFNTPYTLRDFIDDYSEDKEDDAFDIHGAEISLQKNGVAYFKVSVSETSFCCGLLEFGEFEVYKSMDNTLIERIIKTLLSFCSIRGGAALFNCVNNQYSSNRIAAIVENIRGKRRICYNNANTENNLTTYIIPLNNVK